MINVFIFLSGLLFCLAIYWFDVRRLYHQEEEIRPLLLVPLDWLLNKIGLGKRTIREISGIVVGYATFMLAWALLEQGRGTVFDWIWATVLGLIVAIDLRTAYVPHIALIYAASILLSLGFLIVEGVASVSARLIIAAGLYAFSTIFAISRHMDEPGTGGGDPPVIHFIGLGFIQPFDGLLFLFVAGATSLLYGIMHIVVLAWGARHALAEGVCVSVPSSLPLLVVNISRVMPRLLGRYITPIPMLPPFCIAAIISRLLSL